jgi:hypothetical protein
MLTTFCYTIFQKKKVIIDKKILIFSPPVILDNFKISFYKYDNTYYNFHNREHMLTFELDVADFDPSYRY